MAEHFELISAPGYLGLKPMEAMSVEERLKACGEEVKSVLNKWGCDLRADVEVIEKGVKA